VTAASQVFLGGKPMIEARSTNSGYSNPLRRTYSTVDSWTSPPGDLWTLTSSAITGNWVGAKVAFLGGPECGTSSATIVSQAGNTISFQRPPSTWDYAGPNTGNRFYLYGSPAVVDSSKEWYYDSSPTQKKLYCQTPTGVSPNDPANKVEVRTRTNGFDLGNQNYVNVNGFKLQAATINVAGNNNLIDNCQIFYPTPFSDSQVMGPGFVPGVAIGGQNNTVRRSEIAYSYGEGVTLLNSHNTVENNVIHDCGWNGSISSLVSDLVSGNNTIQNNTMYNSGRMGVLSGLGEDTPNNQILHNDISRFGYLTRDLGGIYAWKSDGTGTVIAYNKIHDCRDTASFSAGIYIDEGYPPSTKGFTIHHNLVADCPNNCGMHVKGASHGIYNNTLWNVWRAVGCEELSGAVHTINNLSNSGDFYGTDIHHNLGTDTDQFVDSARGNYTLASWSSANNNGAQIQRITDIDGPNPNPDIGAIDHNVPLPDAHNPMTAGANWKAWTFGNQRVAPLATAIAVASNEQRSNTSPLIAGNMDGFNVRSFLKFDMPGNLNHTTISKAVLRIYEVQDPDSTAGTVTLQRVASAWTEGSANLYNTTVGESVSNWYESSNLDLYTDVDITSWVQGWLSGSTPNYGLRLSGTENVSGTAKYFDSFYGVTAPQLIITVPEPSAILLLSLGLIGILAYTWRRRK
jgi:hypothetical protein